MVAALCRRFADGEASMIRRILTRAVRFRLNRGCVKQKCRLWHHKSANREHVRFQVVSRDVSIPSVHGTDLVIGRIWSCNENARGLIFSRVF